MTGTSEEDSRSSRGNRDVVASFISLSFAFLILALRILTRASIVRNVGAEDYVIVVSFVSKVLIYRYAFTELPTDVLRRLERAHIH